MRLEVAVNDAGAVRSVQPAADGGADRGDLERGEPAAAEDRVTERLSAQELHRDPRELAVDAGVEDLDDGRVAEPRERDPLLFEAGHGIRAGREREHLERNLALQSLVERAIDGAHRARSHELAHAVPPPDELSGGEDAHVTHSRQSSGSLGARGSDAPSSTVTLLGWGAACGSR